MEKEWPPDGALGHSEGEGAHDHGAHEVRERSAAMTESPSPSSSRQGSPQPVPQ